MLKSRSLPAPKAVLAVGWGALVYAVSGPITAYAQTYSVSTLATFNTANGSGPSDLVLDSAGDIYGTALTGGTDGEGLVFEIASGTGTLSTIATFNGTGNGGLPSALTIDSGGNLYGATSSGGADNYGTVFKIAAGSETVTTLVTFNKTNGSGPVGLTLDSAGDLYGTTDGGGTNNDGTVFKIASGTSTLSTLVNFSGTANGEYPAAGVTLDSSGNVYGTTANGGTSGYGTVFKIAAGTSTLSTLVNFNNTNGADPTANLTLDSSGNLYGVTNYGGSSSAGTAFKVAAGTNTLSTLATFTGMANGDYPQSSLAIDSSGNLYGTTAGGGPNNEGTVFRIAAGNGLLTTLASFNGTNGAYPNGQDPLSLVRGGNGSLYVAGGGGANGEGAVFKLTPSGAAATPEPGALNLLPLGLPALAALARRHKAGRPAGKSRS